NLPLDAVQRFVKHATTLRLFSETMSGFTDTKIRHTSRSAALAQNSGLRTLVVVTLETVGGPMMVMYEALERYSRNKAQLPKTIEEKAFALFHKSSMFGGPFDNTWQQLEEDGEGEKKGWRQRNFVTFMNYVKDIFGLEDVIADAYDWKSAGKISVLGGSGGHDAFVLARRFSNLTITVEDLPSAETKFRENVPEDLRSRVSFRAHDFFTPQPVKADVYIIKLIMHDWPDAESIKILRNLGPALKPGARVIVIEHVGDTSASEGPTVPRSVQQYGTAADLRIMALFNAKERNVESYKKIFEQAGERFEVEKVKHDPVLFFATIETVWRG
ncbi:S-adenosyl-L-methionine-dependent methyltransferase, partial [Corynespora cassiicola Philippines]